MAAPAPEVQGVLPDDEEHLERLRQYPVPYVEPQLIYGSVSDQSGTIFSTSVHPPTSKVSCSVRDRKLYGDSDSDSDSAANQSTKELRSLTIQSQETSSSSASRTLFQILYSSGGGEEEILCSQIPTISRDVEITSTFDSIGDLERTRAPITTDYDGDVSSSESGLALSDSEASPISVKKRLNWCLWRTVACSRCGDRSMLREREACIVCDARYCRNCLIRSMGSMPEGRKCIPCISLPINESYRSSLGKCSGMLRKVCSSFQIQQIMKAEIECYVNQLRPCQLIVNRRKLMPKELADILGCPNPPKNLKPGRYWYDKDSGYWGKDGEKPDRIISSNLNVGGKLRTDASKGNTKVYINDREITTTELSFLKLVKVQCDKGRHIWLYGDGSYDEEGQNSIQGNLWGKAGTRFLCSLLSLPVPPTHPPVLPRKHVPGHRKLHQILLIGLEGSGTSTIFKQGKFMYDERFNEKELHNIKLMIQSNMYKYLSVILEGRERFEEEALVTRRKAENSDETSLNRSSEPSSSSSCVYSLELRLKHYSDWLLDTIAKRDIDLFLLPATREYAPIIDELWKTPAIKETYKRRLELHKLPDIAKYFLKRAVEISKYDYKPSEEDMIFAEGVTPSHGLSFFEFSFDDLRPTRNMERYELIHVDSKGVKDGYYCKWLQMLEGVDIILFCVDLSDYDSGDENKMLASRDLFVRVVNQPCFANKQFVLVLNKYDVFEEKVNRIPIAVCEWFKDFTPCKSRKKDGNVQIVNQAYYYVAVKFKRLYGSMTGGRKLFVWKSRGRERMWVDEAFKFVRDVLKWNENRGQIEEGEIES